MANMQSVIYEINVNIHHSVKKAVFLLYNKGAAFLIYMIYSLQVGVCVFSFCWYPS